MEYILDKEYFCRKVWRAGYMMEIWRKKGRIGGHEQMSERCWELREGKKEEGSKER